MRHDSLATPSGRGGVGLGDCSITSTRGSLVDLAIGVQIVEANSSFSQMPLVGKRSSQIVMPRIPTTIGTRFAEYNDMDNIHSVGHLHSARE